MAEIQQAQSSTPEDLEARVKEVTEIFFQLNKSIKNIRLYRHAESRFGEHLAPAHHALTAFLEQHGSLPLKLGPYTLEFKKHVIYEDQTKESLTYKFFRDGMRFLIFRRGMAADELLRFVLLAMAESTDASRVHEDWVTRLWKEEFQSIEYVLVEGFAFGDLSEEEVEAQVEKIVGYLRHQLRAHNDDFVRFARLSPEDLELELSDVEQVRGGVISGRTATPEDRSRFQEDLMHEERMRLFAKMVLILFQMLELDCTEENADILLESVTQVLDSLLVSEDIKGSVALLQRFDALLERALPPERSVVLRRLAETFRRRMVEPQRLDAVAQHMLLSRNMDEVAVRAYLSAATEEEIIKLTDILTSMERIEGRRVLVDVLAAIGKNHAEVFARRLSDGSSNTVRDMLTIIHKIRPPDRIHMYARCLEHPNLMVRLEGLKILAKTPESEALRYIQKAVGDADLQIRLGAYRALATRDPDRAAPILIALMQAPEYGSFDPRERLTIATALGETRASVAFEFLTSLFNQKTGIFSRGRISELKLMAVLGLQAFGTIEAYHALTTEAQDRSNSKELIAAAQKSAQRLKTLLESGTEPPKGSTRENRGDG